MVYWVSTGIICLMLLASATSYLFHANTIEGIKDLGFPDSFRVQLALLKLIAIPVLLMPMMPLYAKEWAYAGVGLYLLTAIVAHQAHGDPIALNLLNLFFVLLLVVSRVYLVR